ncbi:MAG: hypothetical protein JXR83_03380 [Deltaproteobacteria bacterium]|nr:hypothetical protein [Deltaproteobacteria bacterium]
MPDDKPPIATASAPVRTCGACGQSWQRWSDFLRDPRVRILGLQVVPDLPAANLLVFEHACGSTISVLAAKLRYLVEAPSAPADLPSLYGSDACGQECRRIENLNQCDRRCRNAVDRKLAILIDALKKGRALGS